MPAANRVPKYIERKHRQMRAAMDKAKQLEIDIEDWFYKNGPGKVLPEGVEPCNLVSYTDGPANLYTAAGIAMPMFTTDSFIEAMNSEWLSDWIDEAIERYEASRRGEV